VKKFNQARVNSGSNYDSLELRHRSMGDDDDRNDDDDTAARRCGNFERDSEVLATADDVSWTWCTHDTRDRVRCTDVRGRVRKNERTNERKKE